MREAKREGGKERRRYQKIYIKNEPHNWLSSESSLPRLGKVAIFSNAQYSTKDHGAYKKTEKHGNDWIWYWPIQNHKINIQKTDPKETGLELM